MTHSASIVSFDEAKRASRAARPRARRGKKVASAEDARPLVYFDPGADARFTTRSSRTSTRTASAFSRASGNRPARASRQARAAVPSAALSDSPRRAAARQADSSRRQAPSWYDGVDEKALHDEADRRARVRREAREIENEEQGKKGSSPIDRLRKQVAKRKADKVFGRSDAVADEGGPRAALYKGEMGSNQRRASRLQGSADDSTGKKGGSRAKKGFAIGPKMRIAAAAVACLALVCVFLYQPAQQYYQSVRERDALAIEYSALQQRGEALQDSVDALSTEEGMEDLAHEQYGLVKSGETSVNVSGVGESSTSATSDIPPNVAADSIDPPETWYSGILDPLFGVE